MSDGTVILDYIPFSPASADQQEGCSPVSGISVSPELRGLYETAITMLHPKAVYRVCDVDWGKNCEMVICDQIFESAVLKKNLESAGRVFPYIATCGAEIDHLYTHALGFQQKHLLDQIKISSLMTAMNFLEKHLKSQFGIDFMSTMNPGSAEKDVWPLDNQSPLFALLGDAPEKIGVTLQHDYFMIPDKTVSGIFFPDKVGFEMCQLCMRNNCPLRKKEYTGI